MSPISSEAVSVSPEPHPTRTWRELCEDKRFSDLSYRIETDGDGRIIFSPTRAKHGRYQNLVARWLEKVITGGVVVVECAVNTSDGTKVVDVGWFSVQRWKEVENDYDARLAPDDSKRRSDTAVR